MCVQCACSLVQCACSVRIVHMQRTCGAHAVTCDAHAMHMRCTCDAHAMHMRCTCGALAVHMRCTCSAHAVHIRCTRNAHAMHMRYTCDAHAVHTRAVYLHVRQVVGGLRDELRRVAEARDVLQVGVELRGARLQQREERQCTRGARAVHMQRTHADH